MDGGAPEICMVILTILIHSKKRVKEKKNAIAIDGMPPPKHKLAKHHVLSKHARVQRIILSKIIFLFSNNFS